MITSCATCLGLSTLLVAGAPTQIPDQAQLMKSLPRTRGEATVAGLHAPVEVTRDPLGVPVVRGGTLEDVVRAQGFVHAQERYFQMDLLRRSAAGRLAELVGSYGAGYDRRSRRHQFESVADAIVDRMPADQRRLLEAYAGGVNAGLVDLRAAPPEYVVIGALPEPWLPRDSVLTLLTMCDMLHFSAGLEQPYAVMKETLPEPLFRFLTPAVTRFESPLRPDASATPAPIPGPDVIDLREPAPGRQGAFAPRELVAPVPVVAGSNNWAVAGAHTKHGGAIIANDPHLQVSAPGVWFRVELEWDGGRAMGLSLPGSPGVHIGSNTHIAWGFTNTQADFQDLIVIEVDPADPTRYRTPDGYEPFETVVEEIAVRGGAAERLRLQRTRWGVVHDRDGKDRPLVLKWTALEPEMINMGILRMLTARTLEEGVDVARKWYGPSQNILIADGDGRIAWAVSGYFPRRRGFDGKSPTSWADAGVGWDGPMDEALRPVVLDPEEGILYTANNRTVGVEWAARLGDGWELGARAKRIGDLLRAQKAGKLDEEALLAIQLDTRVEVLDCYRDLIVEVTESERGDPWLAEARRIAQGWNGHADVDQGAVVILNGYRRAIHAALMAPLVASCREADSRFRYRWLRREEPVRQILDARPAHLLPPGHEDWHDFLLSTLQIALAEQIEQIGAADGRLERPWGEVNRALVHHPLSAAAPALAILLNMPDAPLPGHTLAVRVATPTFGASTRMVVSPGREGDGVLHIPAGQSGHPLSPHYRDSHPAWLAGLPTPFLAGKERSVIVLKP